ncbi:Sulfotransferase [Candidatus Magnetobacterium bavaricum]|uniref:Sulfotransferase n=1 Tax=Candidatus Magnetobacterium bavaricum TaxID=29290 RepID=A0A0F3GHP0_9BACT|nr:Sulfotransferase [Candidatus Magnetobacterium bavaricum]
MTTDVIVHVGYGKTATTWLQNKIFSSLGDDVYLGKNQDYFPEWLLKINYLDDFSYRQQKEQLNKKFTEIIKNKEKAIISSEAFTNFGVIFQQIERIAYCFNIPRIILTVRHPVNWLISNYKYCVEHEGFFQPLEACLDLGEKRTPFALEKRSPFYLPDLFYDEVVGGYRDVFGSERVLVLKYEDFVSDPQGYGERLSAFIGLELPDFVEKAKHKILVSKPEEMIDGQRITNMVNFIRKSALNIEVTSIKHITPWVLSDETMYKLYHIFNPHCIEFYNNGIF